MRYTATLLAALVVCSCGAADTPRSPAPPVEPLPVATLPLPVATLPPPATGTPLVPATPVLPPPTPEPAPTDARVAGELQRMLDDWRSGHDVAGAVVGLRLPDGGTAVVASGETDDAGGLPIEPGHRFRIGSITKTFVAALMIQLAEDGLLDLDDRLADHLQWAPHAEAVTLRQLLQHTSGMPDFAAVPAYQQRLLLNPARVWEARETVELIAARPLVFEPGSRWAYSNTNYVLAGLVAEEVTGLTLATLLRERVITPLGLDSTFLDGLEPAPPIETAGHIDLNRDGQAQNVRAIPYTALVTSGAAAGGLSSSALDVLDFASGLFGGRLLSPAGLASLMMATEASPGYGLGVSLFTREGEAFVGHAGALPGYAALLAYAPTEGVTVIVLANQMGVDVQDLAERAYRVAVAGSADGGPVVISSRGGSSWGAAAPARPPQHSAARRQADPQRTVQKIAS